MLEALQDFGTQFSDQFVGIMRTVAITDIIDIAFVAYLLYKGIQLIRETRAGQLVKGVAILLAAYALAALLQLRSLAFLLEYIFQFGIIAIFVVFQPELRKALEQVGRTKISDLGVFSASADETQQAGQIKTAIAAVCEAACNLSQNQNRGVDCF